MATTFYEDSPTIKQIWLYTYQHMETRFDYRDRDVLKRISVQTVKTYTRDRNNMPETKYIIESYSYPQYKPYSKVKGKLSKKQRKIKHHYQTIIQLENLTWDSRIRWHVGSFKRWPNDKKIPWTKIKAIHSSIREKYYKKYGKGTKEYKKAIKDHKKKAEYLDVGDYISQVLGLNGDFYYRGMPLANRYGCHFGMCWNKEVSDDTPDYVFFGKHELRILEILMKKKIIKRT